MFNVFNFSHHFGSKQILYMNANRDGMSLNMESFGKILRHLAFYMYCFEFAVESDRKRILFALFLFSQQWTVWKKKENILRVMWQNLELIHSLKHKFVFIILFSMIIHSMGHSFLRFRLDVERINCLVFLELIAYVSFSNLCSQFFTRSF